MPSPTAPGSTNADAGTQTQSPARTPQVKDQAWREWMMVGIGLAGVGSLLAVIVAVAAIGGHPHAPTRLQALRLSAAAAAAASASAAARAQASTGTPVSLQVMMKSGAEHAKLAPDGKYHTATLPANLSVEVGDRVTVTVLNYDPSPHTFTAPALNVNAVIPGGSAGSPSKTTFTFAAPAKAGRYLWYCSVPCDPYSMTHVGYMKGYVAVSVAT